MKSFMRWTRRLLILGVLLAILGAGGLYAGYRYLEPQLPPLTCVTDESLQVPLRVFSRDGALIAEFGEKRRIPLAMSDVPKPVAQAFLAAEDDRFYDHPGVDWQGLARAAIEFARTGKRRQGGSTITMQVARNFCLTRERTFTRKFKEIMLSLNMERELSKDEILERYLNKIYLGNRAYGVGAAAQIYYGKTVAELDLPQLAMLAGLPKAPSKFNPIVNPKRALQRRNYVLGRMLELGFITQAAHDQARDAEISAQVYAVDIELNAPYIAEMARAEMVERYGAEQAYTGGYRVFTTVDSSRQRAATAALRTALNDYDQRHGWRGAEAKVVLAENASDAEWTAALAERGPVGGLEAALVTAVDDNTITLWTASGNQLEIGNDGWEWAREYISAKRMGPKPKKATEVVAVGDVLRFVALPPANKAKPDDPTRYRIARIPEVSGALVALDPEDGGIVSLQGGFDYYQSKFNRAIQAKRQPGSGFKPFIYASALDKGYTAASLINDAPVVFEDKALEGAWRPENYSGKSYGETRIRVALKKSRNLVSIRLLRAVGIDYAIDYASRFGFDPASLNRDLSLSLGSSVQVPMTMARAYTPFANGGFLVEPYLVQRIEDGRGEILFQATPQRACKDCPERAEADRLAALAAEAQADAAEVLPVVEAGVADAETEVEAGPALAPRVISPEVHYLMNSMLRDVVQSGTAVRAKVLGRKDLAGKTGTTNDQRDAWFNGFHPSLVAVAWVGFDSVETMGSRETGGKAALPAWVDFMRVALDGVPDARLVEPAGMVRVRIDPKTGKQARPGQSDAIFETFRAQYLPERPDPEPVSDPFAGSDSGSGGTATEPVEIF